MDDFHSGMEDFSRGLPMSQYANGHLLFCKGEGIGLLTLHQPEKRNALSVAMWEGIATVLESCAADPAVRVLIVSGTGMRAFSSGADLTECPGDADPIPRRAYVHLTAGTRRAMLAFPKPVIARIRGHCLGGGLALALSADIRIAARDSWFGIPSARLGFAMSADMVARLVAVVGEAQARALLFTGTRIDSAEAARIGLVNHVVADRELSVAVLEIARQIAANGPLAVAASKRAINHAIRAGGADSESDVAAAIARCYESDDYREGRTAFAERRPARFRGH